MKKTTVKKLLSLALACAVVVGVCSPLTLSAEALSARDVLTIATSTEGVDVDADVTLYGTILSNPAMYVYECGYTVFDPETQFTVSNTSPDSSAYAYVYYYSYTRCEESTIGGVSPQSGDCSGLNVIDFVDHTNDETADWRGIIYTVDFQGQYLGSDSTPRLLIDDAAWIDSICTSAGNGLAWIKSEGVHRAFPSAALAFSSNSGAQQLYPGDSVTFTLPDDGKDTIYVLFTTIYYPEEDTIYRAWYNIKLGEVSAEEQPDDNNPTETTPPDEAPEESAPCDEPSFVPDSPEEDPDEVIPPPFTDLSKDAWYYDAVEYVYANGLMTGTSDTTFDPNATTTRGMIVTILHRLEGTPAVGGNSGFNDVGEGTWYTDAVQWAVTAGIINGYGNGSFGPSDAVTREQLAAILFRYAKYKSYDISASANLSGFTDASQIDSWALEEMKWANATGLINGRTSSSMAPDATAIRAEFATILHRFCENIAE